MIGNTMSLLIPADIVLATGLSQEELLQEIAIMLFQKEKLTLGQASLLAEMHQSHFQHLLASREIAIHYDVGDFEADLRALREMERI